MENGKIINTHPHDHDKESKVNSVDKFRKILTKRAIEKPNRSLIDIYFDEALNNSEASVLYPFALAESTMRKARNKSKPRVQKLVDVTTETEFVMANTQLHKQFYQETQNISDGSVVVTFIHRHCVQHLGKIDEIHVDCSIKCRSEDSDEMVHMITILAVLKHQDYPIAYGFLNTRSVEAFTCFFQNVSIKNTNAIMPNNILTSTDECLQEALAAVWPDAAIKVMWYYYAASVLKYVSDAGLMKEMSKNLYNLSSLKMLLAIPLMPANYMVPGLDSLKKWMTEKSIRCDGLCEFIDSQWLSTGAEKISIFNGLSHAINNHTQNFYRDLLHALVPERLKLQDILDVITKHGNKTFMKLSRQRKGNPIMKKSQKLQKTILENATHNWIKAIHLRRPIQFLQQVSHTIDDGIINFVINYSICDKKIEPILSTNDEVIIDEAEHRTPQVILMSEPPALVYFNQQPSAAIRTNISTEPPPLVPISRCSLKNVSVLSTSHS